VIILNFFGKRRYLLVLLGAILGCFFGHFWPAAGEGMKPVATGFINLVTMLIGPVIFCTIVLGFAGMTSLRKVGWVGLKAMLYFEAVTTLALVIGLVVVNVVKPGTGIHFHAAPADAAAVALQGGAGRLPTVTAYVLNIIPRTLVGAFTSGEILQVLLVSILVGMAMAGIGEPVRPVTQAIELAFKILMRVLGVIMWAAPLAAFGALAYTVGTLGMSSVNSLLWLMFCVTLTMVVFVTFVLGGILRLNGIGLWSFLRYLRDEFLVAVGTSSSETALPGLMVKMERLGCSKPVVGLVVPAGYSFNLDGTCIYLTMAAVFIAQATDTPLSLRQQVAMLLVLLLTSKGAAAVTGGGFITLSATLQAIQTVPVGGLALIVGIDRFMSEIRTFTNLLGNGVAVVTVAAWEGEFDREQAMKMLKGETR
jgi:aerobic C4-dicarboxylate transport protein